MREPKINPEGSDDGFDKEQDVKDDDEDDGEDGTDSDDEEDHNIFYKAEELIVS